MKNINEIALEKYPPRGMADSQDWEHDENAALRLAFIQGYEYAINELLQSINPSHQERMRRMFEQVNAQSMAVNTAMGLAMKSLVVSAKK